MLKKNFSLVLGGGVARGLIHVGVWKFLQEQNLQPTDIVGTSIGGIVGAGIAIGMGREEAREVAIAFDEKKKKMIDIGMTNGLIKGKKIKHFLEDVFGKTKIEQCRIPLQVVSVDLEAEVPVVFSAGRISDALRATMSVPGVVEPVKGDPGMLVDGGVMANLPIEFSKQKKVLAVSLINQSESLKKVEKRPVSLKKSFLGINYSIMKKSLRLLIRENEKRSLLTPNKEIIFCGDEHNFGLFDFHRYDEMIDFGYHMAKKTITNQNT